MILNKQETLFQLSPNNSDDNGSHLSSKINTQELEDYLKKTGAKLAPRSVVEPQLNGSREQFAHLFYKGDLSLLEKPIVSIVGTRDPSVQGKARTEKVAKVLVDLGFVVMSGLAKGIDTVAHETALKNNGLTIAVFGTPIHKVYPMSNKALAETISKNGLILSPALPHEENGKYLFPRRNRLMALLSKATIIIEAGETSGVVHQAAECLRQKRTLILLKSLAENKALSWVPGFIKSGARVAETPEELAELLK